MATRFIDLSHTVEDGLITYKGLPAPIICDYLSRKASQSIYTHGTEFQIGKIEMVANTGTYVDSPFHRFEHGKDLSQLPIEVLAEVEGITFRVTSAAGRAIGSDLFKDCDLKGKAVLIHTGWAKNWNTDAYFEGHPFLTEEAALYLVKAEAVIVGIDSYNIDDTADMRRPAHTILLGADIPIVEHMCNLESIPDKGYHFSAVPVKVKGFGTFPVRAYARVD